MTDHPIRVLLVEDDESLRSVLARHLTLKGFLVQAAETAEEAAVLLTTADRPQVVLLDLNLPGRTGWDLLRGPELALAGNPPVVVTTATPVDSHHLASFGVAGYLPKPLAVDTLVATIERLTSTEKDQPQP